MNQSQFEHSFWGKQRQKKKAEINLSVNHTTEKLDKTKAIVYPCIGPEMVVALSCGFFCYQMVIVIAVDKCLREV